jgi:putative cell wall-binding protein
MFAKARCPGFGPGNRNLFEPLTGGKTLSTRTKRSSTRQLAAALAVALVASLLALATPVSAKQSVSTARQSGADRFLTSTVLSKAATVAGADSTDFVLVNGSNYADALAAAALAGTKQGTIILLPADGTISADATATMAAASDITIVGGYGALPATVETTMKTLRPLSTITRISGADRYDTAAKAAQAITAANVAAVNGKKSIFLASGTSFADAVMAAPAAYAGPSNSAATSVVPILLTASDVLSPATKAQISLLGIKQVFALGGTAVVSAAVVAEVEALGASVIRLSGANRYSTASAIADKLVALTTAGGFGFDDTNVGIVNIEQAGGGADALAASPYLGQLKAVALGAGASGLATETSAWLTKKNSATGVGKVIAIGGTAAVNAAQLTSADAAATIAGPTATITAIQGQSSVTIAFGQTVTSTSASLTTGYQIMGGTAPTITAVAYSSTTNKVTLTLNGALQTTDVVRVNSGVITTAAGLTVGRTDFTVVADTTAPTCTIYAATGTATITVTCSENIQVADGGALNTTVDGVSVGGTALTADGAIAGKVLTITEGQNWTSTGASIVFPKTVIEDLAGNNVAATSGTVVTDTAKPTIVGLPTYTLTNVGVAQIVETGTASIMLVAKSAGLAGNAITWTSTDNNLNVAVSVTGTAITLTGDHNNGGGVTRPTGASVCAAVNAHASASALVTCYVHAAGDFTETTAATALAGGTTRLTVTTTFSEPVAVANVANVEYDVGGNNAGQVDSATKSVVGSTLTSTWVLDGTAHQTLPAVNVDTIHYDLAAAGGITDLASNQLVAAEKLLAAP